VTAPVLHHDVASRRARAGVAGFLIGAAGMFATMYSTQAILPELSRDFDVSASQAGLTVSVVVLSVALGGWVWGPVSDRIGRVPTMRVASLLLVVPTLGVALAPTFALLLAMRAAQGLCMPGLLVVGAPYVVETLVPRVGARAMGWYAAALVAGGLVGRVGVALASSVVGWRVAIAVLAVLPVTGALAMRGALPAGMAPRRSGSTARGLLNPRLLAVAVAGAALFFTFVGTFTFVPYRLEDEPFDLGTSAASLVFLLWVVGLASPVAGRIAESIGWRRLTLTAAGLGACGLFATLPDRLPVVVAGLALVATGMFAGYTATQLGVGEVARSDRGAATALYFSAYYGAGALGAYLPGVAWEVWGWNGVAVCGLCALATCSAAIVVARALRRDDTATAEVLG
jgi:MFS transporter, YNFM family, putative membrane transport protein